jgi:ubiquinone/menaquinone biosynthesis C-methylase UbiE
MSDAEAYWDGEAAAFDDEADHGLLTAEVRAAWRDLLLPHLPPAPADVVDLGCGTGSLSVLLAEHGYAVRGLDLSGRMVAAARAKAAAADLDVAFVQGDAASPPYPAGSCDVVLCRHVLWALPDPSAALARWTRLLRPGGRLVLVEGRWGTGAGLTAAACEALVREHRSSAVVVRLDDPAYWGRPVDDERYLLLSTS